MALKYRAEMDGLRALAVVSVIVYHLRIPSGSSFLLHGGFLGVDLFFVLSGFLITSILASEIRTRGQLDFKNFYLRRARRILPPLLLVIAVCIPAAYVFLLPRQMDAFAHSVWAALGFYSNFFWYFELEQYGAADGLLQPFLHTWSLAIEEQFYVVFPVVLVVAMRFARRWVLALAIAGLILGFLVAQATTLLSSPISFFSPGSRAWELLAGSALALSHERIREARIEHPLARYLPTLGVVMVIASSVFVDLKAELHPGIATVPTILGTCLVIAFANPRDWSTRLLSTRPLVFIGKLSYSLYLWHYPIFAFGRMVDPHISWADRALWLGLTFACSYAGYRLVELPMRHRMSVRPFLVVICTAVVAAALAPIILKSVDMRSAPRSMTLAQIYGTTEFDNERLRDESWQVLQGLDPRRQPLDGNADSRSAHELNDLWFNDAAPLKTLVVGNSHAKDLFNALYLNRGRFSGVEFARFGIQGSFPADQVEQLYRSPNYRAADVIVFAPRWHRVEDRLTRMIRRVRADGKTVIIVNNTAEFGSPGIPPLYDYLTLLNRQQPTKEVVDRTAFGLRSPERLQLNHWLASLAKREGVKLYSRYDLVCDDAAQRCTQVTPDGDKTFFDYEHWTIAGARYFGQVAAQQGWFSNVADGPLPGRAARHPPASSQPLVSDAEVRLLTWGARQRQ